MHSLGICQVGTNSMVNKHLQTLPAAQRFTALFCYSLEHSAFTESVRVRDLTTNCCFQEEDFVLFL